MGSSPSVSSSSKQKNHIHNNKKHLSSGQPIERFTSLPLDDKDHKIILDIMSKHCLFSNLAF